MADPDEGAQEIPEVPDAGHAGIPDAAPDGDLPGGDALGGDAARGDGPDPQTPDADVPDLDVPDLEIPDAEIPDADAADADLPEPEIPDAEIPASLYAEPVIPDPIIPPAPEGLDDLLPKPKPGLKSRSGNRSNWSADLDRPHTTRAALRAASAGSTAPGQAAAPASDPNLTAPEPDPDVVPPATGATSGGYRAATVVIYLFLLALLVGAIVTIAVLLGNGSTPFAAAVVPVLGLRV
jgi:hypothetical protein